MKETILKLLQKVYFALTTTERLFFDFFSFLKRRPKAKVISVGNLTMGGTGKTPVLFSLLESLGERKVCVLSRGYRSPWERSSYIIEPDSVAPAEMTDEAVLLHKKFPKVPVLIGKNRHHSAFLAEKQFNPELILLDDGFQYRRIYKDINLLLWDALADQEEARLIPAGRMREPEYRIANATAILLTRTELATDNQIQFWCNWLSERHPTAPIIKLKTTSNNFVNSENTKISIEKICKPVLAFAAIGRPESFFKQLETLGIEIKSKKIFRDHHRFSSKEIQELAFEANNSNLQLICTEKDLVKIEPEIAKKSNIIALSIEMIAENNNSILKELQNNGISLL